MKNAKSEKTEKTAKRHFCVNRFFHTFVSVEIDAESMEDAERMASNLKPDNEAILQNLAYDGSDVWELKD